jgi:hypothetical protein
MATQEAVAVFVALLVPIATTIVGTLGAVYQEHHARRTAGWRRKAAFEDASRRVAFAHEWRNAQQAITDSLETAAATNARAQTLLDEAIKLIENTDRSTADGGRPVSVRTLLLAYRMRRISARIIRLVFYVSSAWFLLLCFILLGEALDPGGISDAIWQYIYLGVFGLIASGLRAWAVSVDRPSTPPTEAPARANEPRSAHASTTGATC